MKIKDLFETEQEINIKITNDDLDDDGRLKKQYRDMSSAFYCNTTKITSLKGAPQSVGGAFYCYNTNITSLKGAPQSVGGAFYCYDTEITSLKGAPQSVGGSFYCNNTKITSLKGIGRDFLLEIKDTIDLDGCKQLSGEFLSLLRVRGLRKIKYDINENVENIFNKHLSGDRDLLDCKEELMNAGFKEFAKL